MLTTAELGGDSRTAQDLALKGHTGDHVREAVGCRDWPGHETIGTEVES